MADPFAGGQITHLLSLLGSGRKRPFAVEMLAGIQSGHPHLMVKRHPHADRDEVHVGAGFPEGVALISAPRLRGPRRCVYPVMTCWMKRALVSLGSATYRRRTSLR